MTKQIMIKIDPVGRPEVKAVGYQGVGCQADVEKFTNALGGAVASAQPTEEFYQAAEETNAQTTSY